MSRDAALGPRSSAPGSRLSVRRPLAAASRTGFSFVEVLVASALLVCILLPLLFLFTQATRTTEISLDEIAATNLGCEVADQLKVLPYAAGFRNIVTVPFPNPPPMFEKWYRLSDAGVAFPEANPNAPPRLPAIETDGWSKTGYTYWPPPPDDPLLLARSRLYLSQVPDHYRRSFKTHHPLTDALGSQDPNLFQILIRVEWDRTFLGSPTQMRTNEMGTLVANPTFTL